MKVDTVIPAHNAESTVGDAIASARAQTLPPTKVIVVADACTDRTAEIAERMGCVVCEVSARSVAVARNTGVAAGESEHVAFLDADDLWRGSWLQAVSATSDRISAAVYYGTVEERSPDLPPIAGPERRLPAGDVFEALLTDCFVSTSATVVRRSSFEGVGGFDENIADACSEDYDCWLRIAERENFAPVYGRHVIYRRTAFGAMRRADRLSRLRAQELSIVHAATTRRTVDEQIQRRAEANVHKMSAERFLAHGRARDAWPDIRSALTQSPRSTRLWGMAGLSLLPAAARRFLLRQRHRLRTSGDDR